MTVWPASDGAAIAAATRALQEGRPVIIPTDTVYGLAARATDHDAVATLFEWKGRPASQAMAVLVGSIDQAKTLGRFNAGADALARAFWPGPLTLVLDQQPGQSLALGVAVTTVGLRWPAADFVGRLTAQVGPLTTTSSNRHGAPTPATAQGVVDQLGRPDVVTIDGGALSGEASTVVDATGPDPQILRAGPITTEQVRAVARQS